MIKKIVNVFIMVFLLVPLFINPTEVDASGKTLRDLMNNLNKLEKELKDINNDKSLTEGKVNDIKKNIVNIDQEVINIEKDVLQIHKDIEQLNEDIVDKKIEIKDLMRFFQMSTGENMYLEYAFGASSMTEFIYRLAVVEQLTKHNNELIDNMNNMISSQEKKTKELAIHQKNIQAKKQELLGEQFKLGDRIHALNENSQSVSEEISDAKATIRNYEKLGCKPGDLLSECSRINLDSALVRPVERGYISCGWGCYAGHKAIDISRIHRENIYPTANGRVVGITMGSSCGGNYVTIQHNVGGKYYASRYMHMYNVNVVENQVVTRDTVIGTVGGTPGGVDTCTDGAHLHFVIAPGIYAQDFWSFPNQAINPATVINFPPERSWFNSRYAKY